MKLNLPVHPTMRHPLTGEPLRALYVDSRGRARYPILGAAPDDPPPADPPADPPPADPPAATDPPADPPADPGFPANTPLSEMTVDQQAAYWKDKSQKHEKAWRGVIDKNLTPDQVLQMQQQLSDYERERMSEADRAAADARTQGREEAQREFGPKMARLAFSTALAHRDDREDLIAALNLTSVLTESGDVDTDKVRSIVEKIAPADKGTGGERHNFGAGRRGGTAKSGVGAGADMYQSSRKKSSSTTT